MGLKFFLVWRNWVSSPFRILLTWLGVTLGVAVVASIHVLDHNTILSQLERKRSDFGRVDLELRPLDGTANLDKMRQELTASKDTGLVGLTCLADIDLLAGRRVLTRASLFGLTPLGEKNFSHYQVATGKDISDLDAADRVLISPWLAKELSLKVGDKFPVRALPWLAAGKCVKGKRIHPEARQEKELPPVTTLTVSGILEPFRLARRGGGRVIIGSFNLARKFARPFIPLFQVNRSPGVDPDRFTAALGKKFAIREERAALIGEAADERAFRNGVKVLGCLALALGMFVIFHTLSHSLAEKIRSVGILRSLGATQGQVSQIFLTDAFLISLLGTGSGLCGGILLANVLARLQITTLGMGKAVTTFEIPWSPLLAIAGLAILFTLLGAAFPLLKVRNLTPKRILYVRDMAPPADLMRGVNLFLFLVLVLALPLAYLAMTPLLAGEGKGAGLVLFEAVGVVALFFGIILLTPKMIRILGSLPLLIARNTWPLAAFLVHKNLLRSPGRLASAVCGLTLVALAMLGLKTLTGSLKGEIRCFAKEGLHQHLFLRTQDIDKPVWDKLQDLPGIRAVLPLSDPVAFPFKVIGTDPTVLARSGGILAGRPDLQRAMEKERGMLVSRRLLNLKKLAPGRVIPVPTDMGVVNYKVIAVTDQAGFFPDERAVALVDRQWLHHDFCLEVNKCGQFDITLEKEADRTLITAALKKALLPHGKVGWIKPGEAVEQTHIDDIDRDFFFFDILLLLLLILAGTGQINLITLTALARSREIGVLRALGMTRGDFVRVLLLEAGMVGFIACLLTAAAGLPLSWVLVEGLRLVSGLEVPYQLPWREALLAAALSFGVSLLAALPPALHATGHPPAKAVRSTE